MMSCNAYYCYILRDLLENGKNGNVAESMDKWNEYVKSFGFGKKLGSDFPSELGGFIPDSKYYDRVYGKGAWKATTVISLSIGQGEIGCTLWLLALCSTLGTTTTTSPSFCAHAISSGRTGELMLSSLVIKILIAIPRVSLCRYAPSRPPHG